MALTLALFYYWFAVADRYKVFLYYHDFVSDTSPFSEVTSSRYWMTGLVAGGMVMVLYSGVSWLLRRLVRGYNPPAWWRVWMIGSVPLLVGILLITMTANTPTLPASKAVQVTLVAVAGTGLALWPGKIAAARPRRLFLLCVDGWGMAAVLFIISMLERFERISEIRGGWPLFVFVGSLTGAVVLLLGTSGIRIWRRASIPSAVELFLSGICIAYLLLPMIHHLCMTDGYYYITDSDNFFPKSWWFRGVGWLIAVMVAVGVTRLRTSLARWRLAMK